MKAKENNFEFFNPNPTAKFKKNGEPFRWVKGDCVIRAISGALKMSWMEAYDLLSETAKKNFDIPNSKETLEEVLKERGFETVSCQPHRGERRPTVSELAAQMIDCVCVFNVANHNVYAENGKFYDTWDCGDNSVYTYWKKKK